MFEKLFIAIGAIFVLHSCSMAPRYEKPEAPIPAGWPSGAVYDKNQIVAGATETAAIPWRDYFKDERLNQVIALALDNNRNLQIAALNVQRARAMYGIQRAELLPTLDSTASGAIRRQSSSSFGGKDSFIDIEQYSVDLGISSWEIDFFGRLRNLKDQALEEYLATEEARRSVQISMIFEIANAYLTLAADQENLQLAKTTFETQNHAYDLIKQRYDVGISNELDLRRAQTQRDAARVDISRYAQLTAQDRNALNLLAGSSPPIPDEWLPKDLDGVELPMTIAAGLPSDILLNRPDILSAEHRLKAAYANIGAARSAFFPRISLTAALGTTSGDLANLFSSGTETWNFAPQLVMPIFDSRLRSAYEVTKTDKEIAITRYEQAIQNAFREVADALAVQGTINEQMSAQQSLVDALSRTYQLSDERYKKGVDSYLSVLDAQRSLYAAQQQLVMLRLVKFANQARLYAVLGGGA